MRVKWLTTRAFRICTNLVQIRVSRTANITLRLLSQKLREKHIGHKQHGALNCGILATPCFQHKRKVHYLAGKWKTVIAQCRIKKAAKTATMKGFRVTGF
jgi:hypothetical protein